MFDESCSDSPDSRHFAILTYAGEIRFGPAYFTLSIDGRSFGERLFGHGVLWSPDSAIVCVTEWHTIDYEAGPITSLLLIRPGDWTYYSFPRVTKGFASPNYFIDDSLVLCHTDLHHGGSVHANVELETDLGKIEDWQPIEWPDLPTRVS
ncbi:MAG: hypothetical protein DWQ31_08650 [Planctomycetota bacterium]|nr:MAG: hypothetical protein DWQ31_08650 [Planctomycetota bacterium]REJ86939.1 MAG: hypothetical protein DWQ35_22520 [Planctomycetota bacterium]REK24934.1 MAG: hypothetical protein DWQ42_12650 [Planctomycetota bacterium]REK48523.1 MAG: hypothetical protein DWQ46_02180 [Planctomycetota bacterium]